MIKKWFRYAACCLALTLPVIIRGQDNLSIMQLKQADGKVKQVHTKADWKKKRVQVLQAMQEVMGPLPASDNTIPYAKFTDTLETDRYYRYTVHLTVFENETAPALLYLPKTEGNSKHPAVLALHATGAGGKHLVDSFSKGPYDPIATELVGRGYIVLAPDYPGFGELANHNFHTGRYASGTMKGIFNHMRCIDYLQSRTDVDKNKMGVIGHSLGGHNAIFLGALDERVRIVVSSCGWTLFSYYDAGKSVTERFGGKLGPWAQDRYMPYVKEKFKMDAALMPFDFDELIGAIAPRHFFSNSPLGDSNFDVKGVTVGIQHATLVYQLLGVPANIQVYYPDAGHAFPVEIRQKAYAAMDAVLK